MSTEEPYAVIITGDYNCYSPQWWGDDNENGEGGQLGPLISVLGLTS